MTSGVWRSLGFTARAGSRIEDRGSRIEDLGSGDRGSVKTKKKNLNKKTVILLSSPHTSWALVPKGTVPCSFDCSLKCVFLVFPSIIFQPAMCSTRGTSFFLATWHNTLQSNILNTDNIHNRIFSSLHRKNGRILRFSMHRKLKTGET